MRHYAATLRNAKPFKVATIYMILNFYSISLNKIVYLNGQKMNQIAFIILNNTTVFERTIEKVLRTFYNKVIHKRITLPLWPRAVKTMPH